MFCVKGTFISLGLTAAAALILALRIWLRKGTKIVTKLPMLVRMIAGLMGTAVPDTLRLMVIRTHGITCLKELVNKLWARDKTSK